MLYDNVAGVTAQIDLQLRDYYNNKLISGGRNIELALLGVGGNKKLLYFVIDALLLCFFCSVLQTNFVLIGCVTIEGIFLC